VTQAVNRPSAAARVQSLPPTARTSAEHVRALDAATPLDIRLFKKFAQRPLMSVWQGENKDGQKVLLTVLDACGTPAERARVMGAAHSLEAVAAARGIQHVHQIVDASDAFVCDFLGAGSAADLVVLRWPLVRKLEFVCQVCEALVALHEASIVHGCLCPDNILLDDDLRPVLSEAGMVSIAESLDGDPENFFGYGAFAAPSTKQGAPDVQSDIYSIGRLVSFVVLDRAPDDNADLAEVEAKCPDVAPIVRRCASAEQPYASMAELLSELQRCRARLAPIEAQVFAKRPPEPKPVREAPPKPTAPGVWAPPVPQTKTAAPWWVAMVSVVAILLLCALGQTLVIASAALHVVLAVAVAVATVGLTASIPLTTGRRVGVTLAALLVAFIADPIGNLSRLDASDLGTRGSAARALVQKGVKDLRNKRFQRADFSGLDMTDTDLAGADVTQANFTGTKLRNARVNGTSFLRANLSGADLSGVALDQAFAAPTATCDEATVPPKGWACGPDGRLHQ
jgi:hypothetical protein